MRRASAALSIAALAAALLAAQPARADASLSIAAFQYLVLDGTRVGPAGYLGTPVGPRQLGGPPTTNALATIVNRDPVMHTFTACVENCTGSVPVYDPGVFDFSLQPLGGAANIEGLWVGTQAFGCRIHTWMRGVLTVSG